MDEDGQSAATREGPLGEPAYVPIRNFALYARTAVPRNGRRHSRFAIGGLARLVATVLVAVLIVVALAVIRSGSAAPEPIPVASAPAPSPLHAAPSETSTAFPSSAASPTSASPATASLVSPPLASAPASSSAAVADTGDAVGVGVGLYHSCALTRAGGVKCWGFDSVGQLGNGSHTAANTPVDVVGLSSGIRAIRAGVLDTCAVTTTGGVKCGAAASSVSSATGPPSTGTSPWT